MQNWKNNIIKILPILVSTWRTGIQGNSIGLNSDSINEDAKISFCDTNVIWITLMYDHTLFYISLIVA